MARVEPCDLVIHARSPKQAQRAMVSDVFFERHFSARKQADSHIGFSDCSETTGDRFRKIGYHQLVADFRRS